MLGRGATAGPSGRGRRHQWGWGFRRALRLEEVDAEAQAPVGREISVAQLRHAPGELLHARLQVGEDGEVHLRLQAGGGADGDAGALPLDAQVGLLQVQSVMVLIVLRNGAEAFLPAFPLGGETVSTEFEQLPEAGRSRGGNVRTHRVLAERLLVNGGCGRRFLQRGNTILSSAQETFK